MNLGVAFYYSPINKNSFVVLLGALETHRELHGAPTVFIEKETDLVPEMRHLVKKAGQTAVCFSFFTPHLWETKARVDMLRREFGRDVTLIAGGPHASGDPEGTLKLGFDVAFIGEAEESFPAFLKCLSADQDFSHVPGIAFFDKAGQYVHAGRAPLFSLDKYPPFSVFYRKTGDIEITRGCTNHCGFCQTPHIFHPGLRHRPAENVAAYARLLRERRMRNVRLLSPNAFSYGSTDGRALNMAAMEDLLSRVKAAVGPQGRISFGMFPSEVRPEHVNADTVGLVKKYAGNPQLVIGAQSGSQKVLDACRRGHTVRDVYAAVETIRSAGLGVIVDFMFDLPGETEADVEKSVKAMRDMVRMGAIIHAHTFMPLPDTPFARARVSGVSRNLRKVMEKEFIHKGILFGQWKKQEKQSRDISRYLATGRL
jgi:B12-binding domain/radical SAM domain protein